jgi:hypothetical protein
MFWGLIFDMLKADIMHFGFKGRAVNPAFSCSVEPSPALSA